MSAREFLSALTFAFLTTSSALAQQPSTLQDVLSGQIVTVEAPPLTFGNYHNCDAVRDKVLLTPKFIVYAIHFTHPKAKGNCNLAYMNDESTLETPVGSHHFVGVYYENGKQATYTIEGEHYLVYERRNAGEKEAAQSLYNATGKRTAEEINRSSRRFGLGFELLAPMFATQNKLRAESLDRGVQQFEAAGGIPAYFEQMKKGANPDFGLLNRLFVKTPSLPESPCSQGIYKTIAKLTANHETSAIQYSKDLTGWTYEMPFYSQADNIARINKAPNPSYEAFTVTDSNGTARMIGMAIVASGDCRHAYLKTDHVGAYTNRKKFIQTSYAEVNADFSQDFIAGSVRSRLYSYFTNSDSLKPYAGTLPDIDFMCTREQCYRGTLESVFAQNVLKSSDDWPADIKAGIAKLEQQRDQRFAQEKRERQTREARENEQRRLAEAEAAKRQAAEERAMNVVLNAKDPQVMYLAAGKLERNGESYKARQVYERIVDRFPSSTWAVKANDQLLQNRRVNEVNSISQRANSEAGERAYKACQIEMDSCYSRGGRDCYRNCKDLR